MNRQPYTYYIKNKITGHFYYGVKYGKGADPKTFWKNYFTSSKKVHLLIEKYGKDSFETEIDKLFANHKDALKYEAIEIMKIRDKEKCLNVACGGDAQRAHKYRNLKDKDGLSSYDKAAINTAKTRKERGDFEKMSKDLKGIGVDRGKTKICEYCGKEVNIGNFGRWHGENCKLNPNITKEQLKKREPSNKGIPMSDSQKEKLCKSLKNKVTAYDLIEKKNVTITKEEFDKHKGSKYLGVTAKGTPGYETWIKTKLKGNK